jgi:hypothetical protein
MVNQQFPPDRPEAYFRFLLPPASSIHEITSIISIDNRRGDTIYAYCNRKELENFQQLHIPYEMLTAPSLTEKAQMAYDSKGAQAWDVYPTYSQYVAMMKQFAIDYPSICKLDSIGSSVNGRGIYFVKISDYVNTDEPEPEFMYSSTIHGDEVTGYVLMLRLIDYLLKNYGKDPPVTSLVNNLEIWINPLANPDGTYFSGNNSISGATRYNDSTNLNRNFPDPRFGQHPDGYTWQPENIAMMDFMKKRHFTMSANLHGGAEVVNYPWDAWTAGYPDYKTHPDDEWLQLISKAFADTVQKYGPPGYFTDVSSAGYINGGDWYVIGGGRQDYMTYFMHGREVTIEISSIKMPSASSLPGYWNSTYRSLLSYMQECLYGIHGAVEDSLTSWPLLAKIEIPGYDKDSSFVYSNEGAFFRLKYMDTCNLLITAPGYDTVWLDSVITRNREQTAVSVKMRRSPGNIGYPFVLNELREPADTLTFNIGRNESTELCFHFDDNEHDLVYIKSFLSPTGHIDITGKDFDTCIFVTPHEDFEGNDTLQMVFCDNGNPQLCSNIPVILHVYQTGIQETKPANVNIFPNPFTGELNIRLDAHAPLPALVQLYDLTGRCVYEQTIHQQELRLSGIPVSPGIYQLVLRNKQKFIYTGKVICIR